MKNYDFGRQAQKLQHYYRIHARIYDFTRWSFLFGRSTLLNSLPGLPEKPRILDVGCGTGNNLTTLVKKFPHAQITGLDLSTAMLNRAITKTDHTPKILLKHQPYGAEQTSAKPYDLILLSYSLAMMGPGIKSVIARTAQDLSPGGYVAVVDFHATPLAWFQQWMNANHVTIDGTLPALLKEYYRPVHHSVHCAYGGLWQYFMFVGKPG